jgi:DNA polymerase III subunit chi
MPTEVLFYHLEHRSLESVLPELLERTLQRGWRAVVQTGLPERAEALDSHLWTYSEESFLPHGSARDVNAARHPVVLTTDLSNPNGADVCFLVDGADNPDLSPYARVVFLFDGRNDDAVVLARQQWKAVRAAGHEATYWQQSDQGRWQKKA